MRGAHPAATVPTPSGRPPSASGDDETATGRRLLPLLGITGLKPGHLLGYTAAIMLAAFVIAGACITFLT
jgi:hypothetical protein